MGEQEFFHDGDLKEYLINANNISGDYLPDKSGDSELKYKARLFLYDYHNIIGTSRDTVCSSSEVTWEATGI